MSGAKLYSLVQSRSAALCLWEANDGALQAATPGGGELAHHQGPYLVATAPGLAGLWRAFALALEAQRPLVLLPPVAREEAAILLRQLPKEAPTGAVLALFTSGSSGRPKAVFHSSASLLASGHQLTKALGPSGGLACWLPPWGMAGVAFQLLWPLCSEATLVASQRGGFLQHSHLWGGWLHERQIFRVVANPFLLRAWLKNDSLHWRGQAYSFTAPLGPSLRAEFSRCLHEAQLIEGYGLTEAAGPVLADGHSLGAELRLGQNNELVISGPQLLLGYGEEGLFRAAPQWLPTGDAFTSVSSRWLFTGRLRELIDVGGRKIAPALLEELFEGMPEVSECVAFARQVSGVERPALVYVRDRSCALSEAELAEKIEQRARASLSLDARPVWWREIEAIPRLASGKADRTRVRSEWS